METQAEMGTSHLGQSFVESRELSELAWLWLSALPGQHASLNSKVWLDCCPVYFSTHWPGVPSLTRPGINPQLQRLIYPAD